MKAIMVLFTGKEIESSSISDWFLQDLIQDF